METLIYLLEVGYTHYSKPELIFEYIKEANKVSALEGIFNEIKDQLEKEVAKIK